MTPREAVSVLLKDEDIKRQLRGWAPRVNGRQEDFMEDITDTHPRVVRFFDACDVLEAWIAEGEDS